jgi:hypothetical protein
VVVVRGLQMRLWLDDYRCGCGWRITDGTTDMVVVRGLQMWLWLEDY